MPTATRIPIKSIGSDKLYLTDASGRRTIATAKKGPHGWEVRGYRGNIWPSVGKIAPRGSKTNVRLVRTKTEAIALMREVEDSEDLRRAA